MTALYERFLDPRDPLFRDPSRWDEAATLGHTGRRYLTEEQLYAAALAAEPGADPERRAELRLEAGKKARKNVAFLDATFSVQKSVTVLHTAFEAQEVQAASAAGRARDALAGAVQSGDTGAVHRHTAEVAEAEAARGGVGRASAGGRGRHLGRQQRRPGLPRGEGRLRPGRPPRRSRRPLGRRARLDDRVVLPARLAQPRPAAAHPQRHPQPRPGRRRHLAHHRLPLDLHATAARRRRWGSG